MPQDCDIIESQASRIACLRAEVEDMQNLQLALSKIEEMQTGASLKAEMLPDEQSKLAEEEVFYYSRV